MHSTSVWALALAPFAVACSTVCPVMSPPPPRFDHDCELQHERGRGPDGEPDRDREREHEHGREPGHPGTEAGAHGPSGPAHPDALAPNPDRHLYRLDFAVGGGDGPKPTGGTYTLNVEEDRDGQLHVGSNIPLVVGRGPKEPAPAAGGPKDAPPLGPLGAPRQDVGLMLRVQYHLVGDDLLLRCNFELSAPDDGGAIHKVTAMGDALVTPGKPTLVTSLEEPHAHKRYTLEVTATKLR